MRYRRVYRNGGCYFFTVVTAARRPILARPHAVAILRRAFRVVRTRHPFTLDAIVILPDHLHCIWTLPDADADFSTRWRLVKTHFSKHHPGNGPRWQPRFWEHCIRDESDYARHLDYIHYNPVKHRLVDNAQMWPYSSLDHHMKLGIYPPDWGVTAPELPPEVGHE